MNINYNTCMFCILLYFFTFFDKKLFDRIKIVQTYRSLLNFKGTVQKICKHVTKSSKGHQLEKKLHFSDSNSMNFENKQ